MTALDLPPATRPTFRKSPHEKEILRAVATGATMDALLRCPRWTVDDVVNTTLRYGLVVTETGRLVKKPGARHDLTDMAGYSPSPHVREAAAAAIEQFEHLHEALDEYTREVARDADLDRQHQALVLWRDWLRRATKDATAEIKRLRQQSRKGA